MNRAVSPAALVWMTRTEPAPAAALKPCSTQGKHRISSWRVTSPAILSQASPRLGAAHGVESVHHHALNSGTRLGPYEIVAPLGAGGMGEVYRARDSRLRREVAIKVLRESIASGGDWERFQREARAAFALSHPNICAVYDLGEADGRSFLVMDLLEGQTLRDYIGKKPVPAEAVVLHSPCRSPMRSKPRTPRESCIGISSRATSW